MLDPICSRFLISSVALWSSILSSPNSGVVALMRCMCVCVCFVRWIKYDMCWPWDLIAMNTKVIPRTNCRCFSLFKHLAKWNTEFQKERVESMLASVDEWIGTHRERQRKTKQLLIPEAVALVPPLAFSIPYMHAHEIFSLRSLKLDGETEWCWLHSTQDNALPLI